MNKTNQFSAKTQYVTPSCKSVRIQASQTILVGSDPVGHRNAWGLMDLSDDVDGGVNNDSNDWGY